MKKSIIRFASVLLVGIVVFGSCTKKGEEDPFMSFRSRTSRLAGEWTLSDMNKTNTSSWNGISYTSTSTYNGTLMSITTSYDGNSSTDSYPYSESITIEKDGTYKMTVNSDGDVSTAEGNWIWLGKNKEQDLKDKEAVLFTMTSSIEGGNITTASGKSNLEGGGMVIERLSNKELVFLYDYTETSDGETYSYSGTVTYTQD